MGLHHSIYFTGMKPAPPWSIVPTPLGLPDDYLERLNSARSIARTNIIQCHEKSRHRFKSHKPVTYRPDDLVMVSYPNLTLLGGRTGSRKFVFTRKVPFKIIKALTDWNYEVSPLFQDGKNQVFHVKWLKPFTQRPPKLTFTPTENPDLTQQPHPRTTVADIPDPLLSISVTPLQTNFSSNPRGLIYHPQIEGILRRFHYPAHRQPFYLLQARRSSFTSPYGSRQNFLTTRFKQTA